MNNSEKGEIINKLHKIITYILDSTSSDIVFIPMHKTDKDSFDDYIKNFPNERISCFDYDYDMINHGINRLFKYLWKFITQHRCHQMISNVIQKILKWNLDTSK